FRACHRCRPGETAAQLAAVQRACRAIEQTEERLDLASLARLVGLSPYHLQRTFKRIVGVSPREYGEGCRRERLKRGLRQGESVTMALYDAGFGSSSRLYERDALGMKPTTYQRGGAGLQIRYAVADCPV